MLAFQLARKHKICSKLTIKTPEQSHDVAMVSLMLIFIVQVFPLLTWISNVGRLRISKLINLSCWKFLSIFHDGSSYHIETSPLVCCANQWTGFYMIGTPIKKEIILCDISICFRSFQYSYFTITFLEKLLLSISWSKVLALTKDCLCKCLSTHSKW